MFKHSLDDDWVSAQTDINKPEIPVAWTSDLKHSNTEHHSNTEKPMNGTTLNYTPKHLMMI